MEKYKIEYGTLKDFKKQYESIIDAKIVMFEAYGSYNRNQWQRAGRKYPKHLLKFMCEYDHGMLVSLKLVDVNPYAGTFSVREEEYVGAYSVPLKVLDV